MKTLQNLKDNLTSCMGDFFDYFVKKYSPSYRNNVERTNRLTIESQKLNQQVTNLGTENTRYLSKNKDLESQVETAKKDLEIYHKTIQEQTMRISDLENMLGNQEKGNVGLKGLVARLKKRVYRDNNFEQTLSSLFENIPQFKKIPLLIVQKNGNIFYQSLRSIQKYGEFTGRKLKGDFKTPGKIPLEINKRLYRGYVLPLLNEKDFDYSVVILEPETKLNRILNGISHHDKGIQEKIKLIARQMQEYGLSLDQKIAGQKTS